MMGDFSNDALDTRLAQLQTSEETRWSGAGVVLLFGDSGWGEAAGKGERS